MCLNEVLQKRTVYQRYHNWYVLDEDFSWDVEGIYKSTFQHLGASIQVPVVFCSILQANKILDDLGEEEDEYLRFASGIYWRELRMIFIFDFEEKISLMETIFHEFRHVMQDRNPHFRHYFESDKKLPYSERITEKDAFQFAKQKLNEYLIAI